MDQKDMFTFFFNLKNKYKYNEEKIFEILHTHDIGKLDVSRIYRYLNKYLGIENIETDSSIVTKITSDNNDDDNDADVDE
jgi:hypothetical protein